jgi:hypothetical protein
MDYSATDKHKTILSRANVAGTFTMALAGRWANTSAINQVSIFRTGQTFSSGSVLSLYGIAA